MQHTLLDGNHVVVQPAEHQLHRTESAQAGSSKQEAAYKLNEQNPNITTDSL